MITFVELERRIVKIPTQGPEFVQVLTGPDTWRKIRVNYPVIEYIRIYGERYVDGEFTTNYIQYLDSDELSKKGKNMNDQVQNVQPEAVVLTEEQAAKLAAMAQKLEDEGEVYVQTEENVGTETPTVH